MKNRFVNKSDSGFTLIELLVVILIIAILAAVGIVALLGAIRAGQDSAAKQTADAAYKEITAGFSTGYQDNFNNTNDPAEVMEDVLIPILNNDSKDFEWSYNDFTGDPTNKVSVAVLTEGFGAIGTRSKSGKCFYKAFLPLDIRTTVGAAPPNKMADSVNGVCDATPDDYFSLKSWG
jgi:prepilin-type N-terminal cleavage/methylation domain-containing protein